MLTPISATTQYNNGVNSFKKSKATPKQNPDENPISRKGETMNLIKATFIGGLAVGGKLLLELVDDGDFVLESIANASKKAADRQQPVNIKNLAEEIESKRKINKSKKALYFIGAFVAITAALLCGFAILYTAFNAPKIAYQSKVNTFKKSKEMDVYIKANEAEKELYTQLDDKAKVSDSMEKEKLKEQYLMMKNAKNQVPDFVNIKIPQVQQ